MINHDHADLYDPDCKACQAEDDIALEGQEIPSLNKRINFSHPDRDMLHKQVGVFLLRFLARLEEREVLDVDDNIAPIVDAEVDIFSDKLVEILAGERAFNW